jgi:hypothetical protein
MFLDVIIRRPCLVLKIMLNSHDMLLVRVIHFLVIIVVATGNNCGPLKVPLLPLFAAFGILLAPLPAALGGAPDSLRGPFAIALNEHGPDRLFTRSMPSGDVKQLLHSL